MNYTVIEINGSKVINSSQPLSSIQEAVELAIYLNKKFGYVCSIENSNGSVVEVIK